MQSHSLSGPGGLLCSGLRMDALGRDGILYFPQVWERGSSAGLWQQIGGAVRGGRFVAIAIHCPRRPCILERETTVHTQTACASGCGGQKRRRSMRTSCPAILALLALALSACGSAAGDTKAVPEETKTPERVVALSESIGDLWLLAGGHLKGITSDGLALSGIDADTVSIGTVSSPSLEAILALSPDLVLLSEEIPSQKELEQPLRDAGVTVDPVDINSFADYEAEMGELTELTGRSDLYEKNVTEVGDRIEKIKEEGAQLPEADYLAIRVSATKSKVLKDDSFVTEILDDLNLQNLAEDDTALDELSVEAIAGMDPDYLFVVYAGDEEKAASVYETRFADSPLWQKLTAVQQDQVYQLPKDLFQYKPNARWDEAYAYVYDLRNS